MIYNYMAAFLGISAAVFAAMVDMPTVLKALIVSANLFMVMLNILCIAGVIHD